MKFILMMAAVLSTQACYIESHEAEDTQPYSPSWEVGGEGVPHSWESRLVECGTAEDRYVKAGLECFESDVFKFYPNCKLEACRKVDVDIKYMLKQNLGNESVVTVEAFDNKYFQGSAAATAQIHGFAATKSGDSGSVALYLARGNYYLRAFISEPQQPIIPYELEGMSYVREQPIGLYGALSAPTPLSVDEETSPVEIAISHLFERDPGEARTQARLRIKVRTGETEVPANRDLIIQLLPTPDLEIVPDYQYIVTSDLLKIRNNPGKTEYLTPELHQGSYFVFVFVDEDGNGFYDEGELAGAFRNPSSDDMVQVVAKRVRAVAVELE